MVTFQLKDNVSLREFREDDVTAIYETVLANSERLRKFMHWMSADYSLASAKDFVASTLADREGRKSLPLGIFRGNAFLGSVGFGRFDWAAKSAEIGYWIRGEEEGKGIITEACRILIDFALAELGMNRIEIRCSAENARSASVPKRLGFSREGYLRQAEFRNGRLHDFEIYGLLASEWKNGL